jgi:hypothetical protein
MQHILWLLADVLKYSAYTATLLYVPFAKTWVRALAVQFLLVFAWGIVREISIFCFREDTPPGMYFVILPFLSLAYASIIRGLKLLLFKIPALHSLEESIRARFGWRGV